jgi:hypothetical protein
MSKVLETIKFVIDNSKFVRINKNNIINFSFNLNNGCDWLNTLPFKLSSFSEKEKLHFILIFNAISFSYWGNPKWEVEYKNKEYGGAYGMSVALKKAIEKGLPILNFKYCSQMEFKDFKNILKGNVEIPLLKERFEILKEISSVIVNKYKNEFINFIKQSDDILELLDLLIKGFPSFNDFSDYKGRKIYFLKRGQLLLSDIYQNFNNFNLKNSDKLTACADYKLPQILRKLGILEYNKEIANKIDNKEEILKNSEQEIEIRANTIQAVELIRENIKEKYPKISSFEINDCLWIATQKKNPDDKPYHLIRTTAY